MTELLLVLCGVVVKTAFKLWVRNDPLTDALADDLTEMIKSRVSGVLDQRKIRSRFSQMEEIVAEQLLTSLKSEFRDLDEGERNATIIAATETFNRARLTNQILMSEDLDPFSLERYIRGFRGTSTRDLSQSGTALYDRLLAQCSAYIIELADKLPGFQTDAFSELLSRDRQILARVEEVLARLPARSDNGDARIGIDVAYRQRVVTALDRLELFGLDFSSKWYALSIAYVNLNFSRISGSGHETLQESLVTSPRLVIKGRAGSGKTTVLQWLAVRAARQDFQDRSAILNDYTPFFLKLREYAGKSLPTPEEFLDKIAPLLAPVGRDWPRQQLASNRALVLVDGIDELPESERPAVGFWLRQMVELFPGVGYVITTRPGAIDDGIFHELNFAMATLRPMGPSQINKFINQWHLAMLEWQTDEHGREQTTLYERSLLNRIENDRFLRDLAGTPLLAGLICALNLYLRAVLPNRRGEIYEKALMMFNQRDQARGISGDLTVDLAASNHLLGDLALWMVRNGVAEVPQSSIEQILNYSLASLPTNSYDVASLLRHLILRSGLLREPTAGNIDFVHKSFQEHLAAKALVAGDNIGEIIRNVNNDQWEQVLVLAAGQGNLRQTGDLLLGLLNSQVTGKELRRNRLLAVSCMGEARGATPEALAALNQAIPKLMPPRSISEAEMLGSAGELVVPFIAKLRRSDPVQNAAIIRTAALVGSRDAMGVIAKIAKREGFDKEEFWGEYLDDKTVYGELMRAWEYFDPISYINRVIKPSGLNAITIQDTGLLRYLLLLPEIASVAIESPDSSLDLSLLDNLPDLQDVSIIGSEIESLTGVLRNWSGVISFKLLVCNQLQDISALAMLPNLEALQISYCPKLQDYNPLVQLASLETLWLQGQENFDFSILSEFPPLRDLTVAEGDVADLRPLATMKDLTVAVFDDTELIGLDDISFRPRIIRSSGERPT